MRQSARKLPPRAFSTSLYKSASRDRQPMESSTSRRVADAQRAPAASPDQTAARAASACPSVLAPCWVPRPGTRDLLGDLGALQESEIGGQCQGPAGFLCRGGGLDALAGMTVDGSDEALHPASEPCAFGRGAAVVDGLGDLAEPVRCPMVQDDAVAVLQKQPADRSAGRRGSVVPARAGGSARPALRRLRVPRFRGRRRVAALPGLAACSAFSRRASCYELLAPRDYPRRYGEQSMVSGGSHTGGGPSLRVWGAVGRRGQRSSAAGSIPAGAGSSPAVRCCDCPA